MKKITVVFILTLVIIFAIDITLKNLETDGAPPLEGVIASTTLSVSEQAPLQGGSFEEWLGNSWYREMPDTTYSGTMSNTYTLDGKPSLRFELRKSDPNVNGNKRSAIAIAKREQPLEEHIYSFSTLLPKGGDEDYGIDPAGSEILAQWQNVPDPGEVWGMPALALLLDPDGSYYLSRVWDDAAISTRDDILKKGQRVHYNLGSWVEDKGKFVNWTFHVKWGWLASHEPLLEIYKDGVELLDLKGLPNKTNDQLGVYLKLGVCKWNWAQPDDKSVLTKRVVYYNNVSIN